MNRDDKSIAYIAAEHQANLVRLAAAWAEDLRDRIKTSDNTLLGALADLLENIGSFDLNEQSQEKYLELQKTILLIRAKSFSRILEYMLRQSESLAENESKWARAITRQLSGSETTDISKNRISAIANFANVQDGMTLPESIDAAAQLDAQRIAAVCRDGLRRGKSIDTISKEIRGTKAANFEDGILHFTRTEAETLARTGCCGIADEAKMQFYIANADVIKAVRHVATLSSNTCLVCGNYDGIVWRIPEEVNLIPKLPIHPNCRCVHLPVTEMDEINSSSRPAEAINFWKEAEKQYEQKYPGKHWQELARSTKLKYYYEAQKDYERRTGKPAFEQVPQNMSFEAWLKTKDDDYLLEYFGKTRFDLYKKGKLPLNKFINPVANRAFTIEELKKHDKNSFKKAGLKN